jgi:riboflavin biosynthesis pyrimidine reductase
MSRSVNGSLQGAPDSAGAGAGAGAGMGAGAVAVAPGEIRRLWPNPSGPLSDADIVASLVATEPVLRVNFVSSVDGAVTHNGRSGGLSDDADKRHFELLRRVCDVVLVGAGTVRVEGYGAMRVSEESARWRLANGMSEHPVFAIVSGALDLDPQSEIFTEAPVRPIVFTTSRGAGRAAEFEAVADVVVADAASVRVADTDHPGDPMRVHGPTIVSTLRERGLRSILCEGGPHLFGSLLADAVVDELFLTVNPTLEAGGAKRITAGELAASVPLTLATVLASGSTLLLHYTLRP